MPRALVIFGLAASLAAAEDRWIWLHSDGFEMFTYSTQALHLCKTHCKQFMAAGEESFSRSMRRLLLLLKCLHHFQTLEFRGPSGVNTFLWILSIQP